MTSTTRRGRTGEFAREDDFALAKRAPVEAPERAGNTPRPFPDRVLPMLATPSEYPKDEAAYAFEVKWDGIRALAHVQGDHVRIRTRNLHDVTDQYPELADLAPQLAGRSVVLDGEIVAFDERGMPSFQRLQSRLGVVAPATAAQKRRATPVIYLVFDVLHVDGVDTTDLPYEERRRLLESLPLGGEHVQVAPSYRGQGKVLLATPGLEGVIAKRLGSRYEPGARSRAWLKIKTQRRQEFVIGGIAEGRGARAGRIGALLVGIHERIPGGGARPSTKAPRRESDESSESRLLYAGNVGTGFTDRTLDDLERVLRPLAREASPFANDAPKKGVTFVEPRLVCEVEFTEWTKDGRLRHPSFKGLRDDKEPRDVVREENGRHA